MKNIAICSMLAMGMGSYGVEWMARDFALVDPAALWDVYHYTQEDADKHESITQDMVGKVWWMQYNPQYELDDSNSVKLALDLWAKHGWFSLVWIDELTGEQHRIADSNGAEGEGYYRVTVQVDKNHPLADRLLSGEGSPNTVQMINREKPKPESGTWYAGQYYVDIIEWSVEEAGSSPPIDPIPPYYPEAGFPAKPSISFDAETGMVTCSFELFDDGGPSVAGESEGFSIQGTTNLVSGEWFHVADGLSATIEPTEDKMFLRLAFEDLPFW
jgi:hypothetical protein